MINGTSMLGKHNPRSPFGNATETFRSPEAGLPSPRGPSLPVATVRNATSCVVAWLASVPRRAGSRLFATNDEEARWRGWQVTVIAGGLARQYRDPRFDTLAVKYRPLSPRDGEG